MKRFIAIILLLITAVALGLSPTHLSFNNGQVSPLIEGRPDYQKYNSSCRTIENMFVSVMGPVERRPGTKYVAEVKDSNNPVRLIPFKYSTDDTYMIELGNLYARYYRDGSPILTSSGTEDLSALNNIIAHWKLNDDTSNTAVVDSDGATHDGVATTNTEDLSITAKNSLGFDLGEIYAVSVIDHADFTFKEGTGGDFSLAGWAYITEQSDEQILISKWYEGNTREWKLSLDTSQKLKMCIADESLLLDSDLVAHWKLNDSANDSVITDEIGSNHGVMDDEGDNYTSTHSVAGKIVNAIEFDGINDKVTISATTDLNFGDASNDSPFSISAWINMVDPTSFPILTKTHASNGMVWQFWVNSDDKLVGQCFDHLDTVYVGKSYSTAITAQQGSWAHVVMTYSGVGGVNASDGISLYLNGSAVDDTDYKSGTYTAMHNNATDVYIGFSPNPDSAAADNVYANGKIDNVMVFNKELSSAEVTALYNDTDGIEELDTVYVSTVTDNAIDTGWRYIAMTYNGGTTATPGTWTGATAANYIDLYVDSVDVNQTATNISTYVAMEDTNSLVRIGAEYSSSDAIGNIWSDKLDNIAIFGDVLTPTEVASLYSDTTPYEIVTPYLTSDLNSIQYVQSDNELYLVHGSYEPRKLERVQHDEWTLSTLDFETGPFQDENTDITLTITPSATTGSITLTASDLLFNAEHVGSIWEIRQPRDTSVFTGSLSSDTNGLATPFFSGNYSFTTSGDWVATTTLQRSTDEGTTWENALSPLNGTNFDNQAENEESGAIYRVLMTDRAVGSGTCDWTFIISSSLNNGIAEITGYTSGTVATATVLKDFANTDASSKWAEGYISDYRGWPKTIAFHQQRLVFGGSDSYPQILWFGKQDPDDYTNFTAGTFDTAAFTVALEGQNPIRWLLSQDYLLIGSSGSCGKWGEQGKAVTPTSPNYQTQSHYGSAAFQAILGGDEVLYVERGGRNIRKFGYDFQSDKFLSSNLTILSPEITESGLVDLAFQFRPEPIMWCVLDNGDIATLTYQQDQAVIAWTKQITDGDFESVATIPSSTGTEDEVWVSVLRTIDGNEARYIETFQPRIWGSDPNDAWFVDCGLSYDDTATAAFTGAGHLEGETVSIYANRLIESSEVVVSGGFTIDNAAGRVLVGMPYTSKLETLPLVIDAQDKPMNKKINRVWFDVYKTGALSYGNGADSTLTVWKFDNDLDIDPSATAQDWDIYPGTSEVKPLDSMFVYGSRKKQTVYVETDAPVPMTIRNITPSYDMFGN